MGLESERVRALIKQFGELFLVSRCDAGTERKALGRRAGQIAKQYASSPIIRTMNCQTKCNILGEAHIVFDEVKTSFAINCNIVYTARNNLVLCPLCGTMLAMLNDVVTVLQNDVVSTDTNTKTKGLPK